MFCMHFVSLTIHPFKGKETGIGTTKPRGIGNGGTLNPKLPVDRSKIMPDGLLHESLWNYDSQPTFFFYLS